MKGIDDCRAEAKDEDGDGKEVVFHTALFAMGIGDLVAEGEGLDEQLFNSS